jgi:hypothetical protein
LQQQPPDWQLLPFDSGFDLFLLPEGFKVGFSLQSIPQTGQSA